MALIHDVIDSDVRFIIDPITRTISNQESKKLVLTRGDHNSERFTFEIPRYVEGHDMSLCNVVRIHFINTDSKTREEMADIYEPDDASLLDTNDQLFTFSWLISRTATNFAGPLAFAIEFQCVIDGTVVYSWRTAANSTITIVNGINNAKSNDVEVDEPPTDIYSTIRVATVASMIHDIIDSDVRFIVDPVTRSISNQDSNKLMLIRGDHKSERFTFEIPRFIEGHDMSLCNVVRIHYINTNSKTRSVITDIYEPTDMSAQPEDIVTFSWLIGRSATTFAGTLAFSIEFQCVIDNVIEYSWHTGVNNTIVISDGISNAEVLNEEYSDILTIWWERLYATSELPIEIITQEMFEELGKSVRDNTLYILEDDPTLDEIEKVIEDTKAFDERLTEHLEKYEVLDKNMAEHLEKYTELYENIDDHFEDFENLLDEIKKLEKRITDLENGTGGCKHVWGYIQQGPDLWDRQCTKCGKIEYDVEFLCTDGTEHGWVKLDVTKATCTTAAVQRYYCEKCDVVKNGEVIQNALGHKWSYYEDSTAELTGWSRVCPVCETVEKNVRKTCNDGDNHTYINNDVIPPTCTTPYYVIFTCSQCGDQYRKIGRPALGHEFVDGVCTVCGVIGVACEHEWLYYEDDKSTTTGLTRKCVKCEIVEIDVECECYGDEHDWFEEVVIDNTCTAPAYQKYRCSICGKTKVEELTAHPALGHSYVNGKCIRCGSLEETCVHTWSYIQQGPDLWDRQCTKCKKEETDVVFLCTDGTDHNWTEIAPTTAACTSASVRRYMCNKCDVVKNGEIAQAALGHSYVNGKCIRCDSLEGTCDHTMVFDTSKEPTCFTDGFARFKCSKCNDYYEETPIKAVGEHTKGTPIYDVIGAYEPTCGVSGYAAFSCTKCDETFWDTVPATGDHSFGGPIYNNAEGYYPPTCTETGYAGYVCSKCGGEKSEVVPPLQHNYTTVVTPPTCDDKGYTTYTCDREGCGYGYIANEVPATGQHEETLDTDNSVAKTCDMNGVNVYKCLGCGVEIRREVVPAGHGEMETEQTKPTCTTAGSNWWRCKVCGEEGTEIIPATGHTSRQIVATLPATCTTAGFDRHECSVCRDTYDLPTEALGHYYTEDDLESETTASCKVPASKTYKCQRCGESVYVSIGEKLEHDWVYKECGSASSSGWAYQCSLCGDWDYSSDN